MAFAIIRNGEDIGRHVLGFSGQGSALEVEIAIDILVKYGPLPLYHYTHRATEVWNDAQFVHLHSQTNNNGTQARMQAERQQDGIHVQGSRTAAYVAPHGVLCSTYWNRAMLQPQVISSQDGRLLNTAINPLGDDRVGGDVAAHYALRGDLKLDIWYDRQDQWTQLSFVRSNSTIVYDRL